MSGLLFLFLTKRKSGWGICGSSWCLVWFLVCCDLPALLDLLGPCTNVVLTAYAHVRTEPQCDIGHTRGKKNHCFEVDVRAIAVPCFRCEEASLGNLCCGFEFWAVADG